MVNFFSPNIWQMMTFLNALIPETPFSFFCRFLRLGHLRGPGVSLGRILGHIPRTVPAERRPALMTFLLLCMAQREVGRQAFNWRGGGSIEPPGSTTPSPPQKGLN